jgi:hypothetical protein
MSRRKGKRKGEKHVRLHRWLLNSQAWIQLSPPARSLLVELYDLYDGENNGELFMSVREASWRIGISVNPARKAIAELREKGFIRPHQRGAFTYKERHATNWVLTEFSFAGALPTRDFMRWQPAKIKTRYREKIQTASRGDTDAAQESESVSPRNTDYPPFASASVSRGDTQIVNHGGSGETASPACQQIDLEEAIEAARQPDAISQATATDLAQSMRRASARRSAT